MSICTYSHDYFLLLGISTFRKYSLFALIRSSQPFCARRALLAGLHYYSSLIVCRSAPGELQLAGYIYIVNSLYFFKSIVISAFFSNFHIFFLVSRSAPGELKLAGYILFQPSTPLNSKYIFSLSTSSSTNRSKNMVTGGFLLLSSFEKQNLSCYLQIP